MKRGPTRRDFVKGSSASVALVLIGCDADLGTTREARVEGATPTSWTMSVCPYCGVGCGVEVGVEEETVVAVRGMADHPVNQGQLCLLGQHLVPILDTDDRLLTPMTRRAAGFARIGWDEAERTVAEGIRDIIDRHGPDAFAMYVSASEYIEEYYVYNKFVKGCLGTNNLESSARLCWASGVVGLVQAFGADSPPCAYEDFDFADLFFVAGYNLAASKPVIFRRMIAAKARTGAPLIVVDPRRTDTAARADLHLAIRPGTDVALHNAIAHVLTQEGLVDEAEAQGLTENFDALKAHVADFTPQRAAQITDIPAEQIVDVARRVGRAQAGLFMWGQGLNQSSIGTRKVTTLLNLVFITGNLGKKGAGPMAITGQGSAMGLRKVGALPHLLPGFRTVAEAPARAVGAGGWGVDPARISPDNGKPINMILESIDRGEIKALWIIHSNPAATFPDSSWVRSVLPKTELLIVQDCYHPTETTRFADILLPGAQWAEKGGTLTNSERGLNLIERAVPPPGEARPDLDIVMGVARRMGFTAEFPYRGTEAIFEEYKTLTADRPSDIRGVTYARLREDKGIQWPVPTADHPGTQRRFMDRQLPRGKVRLSLTEHQEPGEGVDAEYPLVLITGLVAMQYHSRTRTGKIEALRRAMPEPFVELHPDDAEAARVQDGQWALVSSRRGTVRARAKVSATIRPGAVFMPYHFGESSGDRAAVNALTHRAFDESANQPEYKACAVKVVGD
jgi:anaerobic selenocysteine-containing dehydrogenase